MYDVFYNLTGIDAEAILEQHKYTTIEYLVKDAEWYDTVRDIMKIKNSQVLSKIYNENSISIKTKIKDQGRIC